MIFATKESDCSQDHFWVIGRGFINKKYKKRYAFYSNFKNNHVFSTLLKKSLKETCFVSFLSVELFLEMGTIPVKKFIIQYKLA